MENTNHLSHSTGDESSRPVEGCPVEVSPTLGGDSSQTNPESDDSNANPTVSDLKKHLVLEAPTPVLSYGDNSVQGEGAVAQDHADVEIVELPQNAVADLTAHDASALHEEEGVTNNGGNASATGSPFDPCGETARPLPPPRPSPRPRRFRFWSLDELFQEPEPQWLIADFLVAGASSLLTAQHASFKSFVALSMALCVATGRDWYGHPVQAGPVLYIAAEGGNGLRKRAGAWLFHHGVHEYPTNFYAYPTAIEFANAQSVGELIAELAFIEPALIVVDTLARCAAGMDENSAHDMSLFIQGLDLVSKQTRAHVMIVHHNNKNGTYRGSSSLPAAVDTHFAIQRKGEEALFSTEKQKDAPQAEPHSFRARSILFPHPGHTGEMLNSIVLERTDAAMKVAGYSLKPLESKTLLHLVEAFGEEGASAQDWERSCKNADIVDSTHRRTRRNLVKCGAVVMRDKSGHPITKEQLEGVSANELKGIMYYPASGSDGLREDRDGVAPLESASTCAGVPWAPDDAACDEDDSDTNDSQEEWSEE